MALLSTKSHLVSTAGGLLTWFSGGETPKKEFVERRSILRDPSNPSPRKQQCFYASPVTGGPVEGVYRYDHPSPHCTSTGLERDQMESKELTECALHSSTDAASNTFSRGRLYRKRSYSPLMTPSIQAEGCTCPSITSPLSYHAFSNHRSQSNESSYSDSDEDTNKKWHMRSKRYTAAAQRSRRTPSPTKTQRSCSVSREASSMPRDRTPKRSSSDGSLIRSQRMAESQRRSSFRQRASQDQINDALAKLQLEGEEEQAATREKARLEAEAERERKAAIEWERRAYRIVPSKPVIASLTEHWESALADAMNSAPTRTLATAPDGNTLTRRDFGTLYPQQNTYDNSSGWLNDEIINTSMQHVIAYALDQTEHKRGTTPKFHAFASQFYNNLSSRGPQSIARWSKRAKIGGTDLLNVDYVFIPVNPGVHWTLLVVMPSQKLVEYFDSYHGDPEEYLNLVESWLEMELGQSFSPDEWIFRAGLSPTQTNAKDCGVYLVTTAKMIMLGIDPEKAYCEKDLPLQRKRIACELMNGGFSGDFEPMECGKPGVTKRSRSRRGSSVGIKPKDQD